MIIILLLVNNFSCQIKQNTYIPTVINLQREIFIRDVIRNRVLDEIYVGINCVLRIRNKKSHLFFFTFFLHTLLTYIRNNFILIINAYNIGIIANKICNNLKKYS